MEKATIVYRTSPSAEETVVPGQWRSTVFIPDTLAEEVLALEWLEDIDQIAQAFPDSPLVVSSVVKSLDGTPRHRASSHARKLSLDLAPMYSPDTPHSPDFISPRISDNRALACFLALLAPAVSCGIVLEGDHFHLDRGYPPGAYLYSTYRTQYSNDSKNSYVHASPIHKVLFRAKPNGEIVLAQVTPRLNFEN